MQQHLIDYIRRPDTLDAEAVTQLQTLVKEYPYFHTARILLMQALYKQHAPSFDEELRRSATLVPNRQAIFQLIERPHYTQTGEHKRFNTESGAAEGSSLTTDLIDDFLSNLPAEPTPRGQYPVDATQDYIGYLLQCEKGKADPDDLPMNGGGVVEEFLQQPPSRIQLDDALETPQPAVASIESKPEGNQEILTEIMAGIYIKQGKYENAIKIIRQLSLKYPKKNRYFADQIRFLEKLIINNKNK